MERYLGKKTRIDHIAIAVSNLDEAISLYRDVFGFKLLNERSIRGTFSGMISAELDAGGFSIVLVQGTDPDSQVTRYVNQYGPGVQHVAIEVENVQRVTDMLRASGVQFATDVIRGTDLIQIFTRRDANSGMMFEFIERQLDGVGFETDNIQSLFNQLEESNAC